MVTRGSLGARLCFALAVLAPALLVQLPTAGSVSPFGVLTAGLAAVVVAAVVIVSLPPAAAPARIRAVRLHEYGRQAAFLPLRDDPDAPGRPRSRAPSARRPAA